MWRSLDATGRPDDASVRNQGHPHIARRHSAGLHLLRDRARGSSAACPLRACPGGAERPGGPAAASAQMFFKSIQLKDISVHLNRTPAAAASRPKAGALRAARPRHHPGACSALSLPQLPSHSAARRARQSEYAARFAHRARIHCADRVCRFVYPSHPQAPLRSQIPLSLPVARAHRTDRSCRHGHIVLRKSCVGALASAPPCLRPAQDLPHRRWRRRRCARIHPGPGRQKQPRHARPPLESGARPLPHGPALTTRCVLWRPGLGTRHAAVEPVRHDVGPRSSLRGVPHCGRSRPRVPPRAPGSTSAGASERTCRRSDMHRSSQRSQTRRQGPMG